MSIQNNALVGAGGPHKLLCVSVLYSFLDIWCDLCIHGNSSDMCPLFRLSDSQSESKRAERYQIHYYDCLYCLHFGAYNPSHHFYTLDIRHSLCHHLQYWFMVMFNCYPWAVIHTQGTINTYRLLSMLE